MGCLFQSWISCSGKSLFNHKMTDYSFRLFQLKLPTFKLPLFINIIRRSTVNALSLINQKKNISKRTYVAVHIVLIINAEFNFSTVTLLIHIYSHNCPISNCLHRLLLTKTTPLFSFVEHHFRFHLQEVKYVKYFE